MKIERYESQHIKELFLKVSESIALSLLKSKRDKANWLGLRFWKSNDWARAAEGVSGHGTMYSVRLIIAHKCFLAHLMVKR